jgi:hypothetical protein
LHIRGPIPIRLFLEQVDKAILRGSAEQGKLCLEQLASMFLVGLEKGGE